LDRLPRVTPRVATGANVDAATMLILDGRAVHARLYQWPAPTLSREEAPKPRNVDKLDSRDLNSPAPQWIILLEIANYGPITVHRQSHTPFTHHSRFEPIFHPRLLRCLSRICFGISRFPAS
jgi:hypothetical protein